MATRLESNLKKLATQLPLLVKSLAEEFVLLSSGMIAEEMGERALSDDYRTGKSDSAFANNTRKNTGTKLRVASGTLVQSFTPNKPFNENQISVNGGRVTIRIASSVPYAAIHEYGGTIKHPGGTAYFVRDGRAVFVSKAKDDGSYRKTKAHDIPMPARPYLNPAIKRMETEGLPVLLDELADKVRSILGGA